MFLMLMMLMVVMVLMMLVLILVLVFMMLTTGGSLLQSVEVGHVDPIGSSSMIRLNGILDELGSRHVRIWGCTLDPLGLRAGAFALPLLAWRSGQSREIRLV
jgi:hypothetical protein